MSELPAGWALMRVGEAGDIMLGRQRSPRYHSGPNMRPYLRVKNVFENRIDLSDVMEMDFSPSDFERYRLGPGDILLNEGQSPELIGRPAMYRGELPGACFTNSLIRFRPCEGVDGNYSLYLFLHHLWSGRFRREARITTNIAHLSAGRFSTIEFPLPPLNEQRRIVAAIEEQLSRLDAADASLTQAKRRLEAMRLSISNTAFGPIQEFRVLGELAQTQLGKMLSAKSRTGVGARPYLRNKNVQWGRIDVDDLLQMDFSERDVEKFELRPGDVLVCEGGEVGRAAVWRGQIEGCCYQKALHRLRVRDGVSPEYLVHVLRWMSDSDAFDPYVTGSTIKHLPQEDLRLLPIPTPPLEEQRRIVAEVEERLSAIDAMRASIERAQRRSAALRRSILERAFRGELVTQNPSDEPASVLLDRIRADREATPARVSRR